MYIIDHVLIGIHIEDKSIVCKSSRFVCNGKLMSKDDHINVSLTRDVLPIDGILHIDSTLLNDLRFPGDIGIRIGKML